MSTETFTRRAVLTGQFGNCDNPTQADITTHSPALDKEPPITANAPVTPGMTRRRFLQFGGALVGAALFDLKINSAEAQSSATLEDMTPWEVAAHDPDEIENWQESVEGIWNSAKLTRYPTPIAVLPKQKIIDHVRKRSDSEGKYSECHDPQKATGVMDKLFKNRNFDYEEISKFVNDPRFFQQAFSRNGVDDFTYAITGILRATGERFWLIVNPLQDGVSNIGTFFTTNQKNFSMNANSPGVDQYSRIYGNMRNRLGYNGTEGCSPEVEYAVNPDPVTAPEKAKSGVPNNNFAVLNNSSPNTQNSPAPQIPNISPPNPLPEGFDDLPDLGPAVAAAAVLAGGTAAIGLGLAAASGAFNANKY